jgi:phosphate acetyltransferase
MTLLESFKAKAKANPKRIVLPEGEEPRTVRAAVQIMQEKLAQVVLIDRPDHIPQVRGIRPGIL